MRSVVLHLTALLLLSSACSNDESESQDASADGASSDASIIKACADLRATCKAISDCSEGSGLLVRGTCSTSDIAGAVCCAELTDCPEETFACCYDDAQFRPLCDPEAQTLSCDGGEPC